jgi:Spy/CpxP family protein refolding chaperone
MKTLPTGSCAIVATTLLLGFGLFSPAGGQPRPERSARSRSERMPPGAAVGRVGPGFERVMSLLTGEQRASLREAMEAQREKTRELEEQIRRARAELFSSSLSQTFDEETVRSKAMTAAKLEAEMSVLRAKVFSTMKPALSVEQLREIRESFPRVDTRSATPPRRPDRDENDLPSKDRAPSQPKPEK